MTGTSGDLCSCVSFWHRETPLAASTALRAHSARRTLSIGAPEDQSALVFAAVFVIVWCGAGVVTLNAALLGGQT